MPTDPCFLFRVLLVFLVFISSPLSVKSESNDDRPLATGKIPIDDPIKVQFRKEWEFSLDEIKDIRSRIRKYEKIVPVIGRLIKTPSSSSSSSPSSFLEKRAALFEQGVYPGVEYRVVDILTGPRSGSDTGTITTLEGIPLDNKDGIILRLRPAYPLIPELERQWPVDINLKEIPVVLTRAMYNTATVLASAGLALSLFLSATLVSQAVTVSFVNSKSMEPTILPRDVILVEKVSPFVKRDILGMTPAKGGDVVFFTPPPNFTLKLSKIDGAKPVPTTNTLLVKRVVDKGGDSSSSSSSSCFEVRGDNGPYSFDSRDWGCLPSKNIVGKPLFRILPLSRFGSLSQRL